jgi:hypothetical protein
MNEGIIRVDLKRIMTRIMKAVEFKTDPNMRQELLAAFEEDIKAIISKYDNKYEIFEAEDHEIGMAMGQLEAIFKATQELEDKIFKEGDERNIPAWIQSHITSAYEYLKQANDNFHEIEEGISPANIGGMGPIQLPTDSQPGSGDVPAGRKSEEDEEDEKEEIKEMKEFIPTFEKFISEARSFNDPLLIKMRAAQMKAQQKKEASGSAKKELSPAKAKKLAKLQDQRAEIMRDMEQEAEMEGGEIADRYGDMLNKIDKQIAKLTESVVNEAKSIAKIQKEWGTVTSIMKDTVAKYKTAKGQEKKDLLDELKTLTASKKKLEAELDAAVGLKDVDAELTEGVVNEMDSEGVQSLADELNGEVYIAKLKNGAKSATITATTTTKTWDDGAPILKYLARGKAKSMSFDLYQRSFKVIHDPAHDWFYFTDGRKWYGLHGDDGYFEPSDLPFDMEVE